MNKLSLLKKKLTLSITKYEDVLVWDIVAIIKLFPAFRKR